MPSKLTEAELGYALAILDSIGSIGSAVKAEDIEHKFSAKIVKWLVDNKLLVAGTLNFEGEIGGVWFTRGKKAIDFYCAGGESILQKMDRLRSIYQSRLS